MVGDSPAEARLLAKSQGVVAGVPFFDEIFKQLDCTVEWHVTEGDEVGVKEKKQHVATVKGPVRCLLLGERVALNTLARCSGVATKAHALLSLLRKAGYKNTLAGTRKTTPGFRLVEKYGMLVGGCDPHRQDLSAMTMLKDNHIWACGGSIPSAVAIEAGADVVMLDNFSGEGVKVASQNLKERWGGGKFLIEVSGGLTEDNVSSYVCDHIDIISSSSIHQGVKHVDFSLKVIPKCGATNGKMGTGESLEA